MFYRFGFCVALFLCSLNVAAQEVASGLKIVSKGQSNYVITIANNAISSEKNAAVQLQSYIKKISNVELKIINENEGSNNDKQIFIGAGQKVKQLLPSVNWSNLGEDAVIIKTVGSHLILAGDRPRGTLYAVIKFLEDNLGCKFWAPGAYYVPSRSSIIINSLSIFYTPKIKYREIFTTSARQSAEFAAMLNLNGFWQKNEVEWGGKSSILGFAHTFSKLLPVETYFKMHPEWYSDSGNSFKPCSATSKMPIKGTFQICLSNDDARAELTKNALLWIDKNKDAFMISISQEDNEGAFCQCENCLRLKSQEGSWAGPLIYFINQVSADIGKKYPNILVGTLAYRDTEKPPFSLKPNQNVLMQFAPINLDIAHPFNSSWNDSALKNFIGWRKMTNKIFIWNYITNFRQPLLPNPGISNIGKDIQFFNENNIQYMFEQANDVTNGIGYFDDLKTWVAAKMMWNPDQNPEALTKEFMNGYYGLAGPYLEQYRKLVENSFLKNNQTFSAFNNDLSFLSLDVMNNIEDLLKKALSSVQGKPIFLKRVLKERVAVDYAWLYQYNNLKNYSRINSKPFTGPNDHSKALSDFKQKLDSYDVKMYDANSSVSALITQFRAGVNPISVPSNLFKKIKVDNQVYIQQNAINQYWLNYSIRKNIASIVEDPLATDKQAVRVNGNDNSWVIQLELNTLKNTLGEGSWDCYALVRIKKKLGSKTFSNTDGTKAINYSLTSLVTKTKLVSGGLTYDELSDEKYHLINFGIADFATRNLIWIASGKNSNVDSVYFDSFVFIRK